MTRWALAALGLGLVISGCSKSDPLAMKLGPLHDWAAKQPQLVTADKESERDFALSSNAIAFKFFAAVDQPGKNVLISPISLTFNLAMLGNGASGKSKDAIYNVLHSPGGQTPVNQNANYLLRDMMGAKDSPIVIANSLWLTSEAGAVDSNFQKVLSDSYGAKMATVSTSGSAGAGEINAWNSQMTNGLVDKAVDDVPPGRVAFLVNAIAFASHWKDEFDPKMTSNQPFNLSNRTTVDVPFLRNFELRADGYDGEEYRALRLPYKSVGYSLVLLLPNKESPETLLQKLTWESWGSLLGSMTAGNFAVQLPKLTFHDKYNLMPAFKKLGLGEVMASSADMNFGMKGVALADAHQSTFIEISEQGTRAAASTADSGEGAAGMPFYCDKPFAFAIVHDPTNAILLLGVVNDPSQLN